VNIRRIVDTRDTVGEPIAWHYELTDITPNSDGLYEVPVSVHHIYPPGDAQNFLQNQGFVYVSKKRGNYDFELWRKVIEISEQKLDDGTLVTEMNIDLAALLIGSLKEPEELDLVKTDVVCPRCGSRVGSHGFRISDHHNRVKVCGIWLCMNPGCDFHFTEVERT
jgi:hypothetical protein